MFTLTKYIQRVFRFEFLFIWCSITITSSQDYVTIFDGYTTRDPVILKFCGGGESIPATVSSGPELLVEFTTSPFGTFLTSPSSIHNLNGFQLEVSELEQLSIYLYTALCIICTVSAASSWYCTKQTNKHKIHRQKKSLYTSSTPNRILRLKLILLYLSYNACSEHFVLNFWRYTYLHVCRELCACFCSLRHYYIWARLL